ncbi:SpoIID/LytB domain-containing protein, partial [Pseudokineococcus marinus]
RAVLAVAAVLGGVLVPLGAAPASAADVVAPVDGGWELRGHGWGHGNGMSQWGAQSRAAAGQTADEILDFSYPGTTTAVTGPRTLRVGLTALGGPSVSLRSAEGRELVVSTSGRRVRADQTLVLDRSGTSVRGVVRDPGGAAAWSETWTTAPVVTSSGRLLVVRGSGGTVVEGAVTVPTGSGTVVPVNVLDLEAYLRGVVPAESPASWHPAALQAQAVAARSYVLATLTPRAAWDTCDTTACQVYLGYETRSGSTTTWRQPASTNAAVAATAGRYRAYGGAPAFTQFSSSNGGWSADGGKPYLVPREDPFSVRTGSATGDALGTWTARLSVETASRSCPSGGRATGLAVTGRDGRGEWGGRITRLEVHCTTGVAVRTGASGSRFDLRSSWWTFAGARSDGAVDAAWAASGGDRGPLRAAVGPETSTPDGRGAYRAYERGSVYWTATTGAHVVRGAPAARWAALGFERSSLGYPVSGTTPVPGRDGLYQHFEGGSLYYNRATGTRVVAGPVRDRWASLGWEGSALGFPTSDTTATPDRRGTYQHFQGGSVYATPSTGARVLSGALRSSWAQRGWERSPLGYPTGDAGRTADGRGSYQWFQGGLLLAGPGGTRALTGGVLDAWARSGSETGALAYPTTEQGATPDGRAAYQHFQGGSVYAVRGLGASAVERPARDAWARAGWERSRLGYPTGSTRPAGRGTVTPFEGGRVVVDAAGRAVVELS